MNLIEHEWQHLKAQELAGRMFVAKPSRRVDEYDLALAVADGVEARAQKGRSVTERFTAIFTWVHHSLCILRVG